MLVLMFNEHLFLEKNYNAPQKIKLSSKKEYVYKNLSGKVDLMELKKIFNFIYSIKCRHRLSLLPIVIDLGRNTVIDDKLTYILLECICYNLVAKEKCILKLLFHCPHNIYNEGIKTSSLRYLNGTKDGMFEFVKHFSFEIKGNHYRQVIKSEKFNGEQTARTSQDIDSFLKNCMIQEDCHGRVSDIVGELLDNSLEHSKSDCLIDIDVTTDYEKRDSKSPDDLYCGVNIVVLNFSDILLGEGIATKLDQIPDASSRGVSIGKRYLDVLEAKKYHSACWNNDYQEEDFYIISSFQHKISCRPSTYSTGGTGLTQLIKGLEDESDAYRCYMLSGNRKINFIKNMLTYNEENWVGFNETGDFLKQPPSLQCLEKSILHFPGTAYNLNFVMKREVI